MTEFYTHGHHASVLKSHSSRTIANSAAYLSDHLASGLSLLDVGCGPGTITTELAERLDPGQVIGLDASEEVIAQASATAGERGITNLDYVVGDAYALPFADNTFDIVHAHQVLQHLGSPVVALSEMRRVLKPGGLLAVRDCDYGGTVWYPELPGLSEWIGLYNELARSNQGEPNAGRFLLAWVREAGFSTITKLASVWDFSNDADRDWWGSMWRERALHSQFAVSALERGMADDAQLQRISLAWEQWRTDPAGTLMMPHGEILARK